MSNKKYYYYVCLISENETSGYVLLTQEEADLVNRAANPDNWEKLDAQPWSGFFFIDNTKPISPNDFHSNEYWDKLREEGFFDELETEEEAAEEPVERNGETKKKK